MRPIITSVIDERLVARVVRRVSLTYADGADAATDRPAHVRAASGLAWVGRRLAVVQDDANFIALVDPDTGRADVVTLPAGARGLRQFDDGRGNKRDKLDLESVAAVLFEGTPRLLAIGSGSTRRRDHIATVTNADGPHPVVCLHETRALHGILRATVSFAGSELNLEGAYQHGAMLRLVGRGNGSPKRGLDPIDATCDVSLRELFAYLEDDRSNDVPTITAVQQYRLGEIGGIRLTFTDAIDWSVDGNADMMLYTAAAEASPDASRDGWVAGSAIGVVSFRADGASARHAELRGEDGAPIVAKVEGIVRHRELRNRVWIVIDVDAHDSPSELCEVELTGAWRDVLTVGSPDREAPNHSHSSDG